MDAGTDLEPLPPVELRSARLWLVHFAPAHAEELARATTRNLDHLRPWLPWAHRLPEPLEETVRLLEGFQLAHAAGRESHWGIWEEGELVGGIGLHARVGPGGLEIGYWIDAGRLGRGLATEAAAVVTRVALERCGVARVQIHVQPENAASLRVPEKLGYVREGRLRARLPWVDGSWRDQVAHSLLASELAASPAAGFEYEAFDERGDALPPAPLPEEVRP